MLLLTTKSMDVFSNRFMFHKRDIAVEVFGWLSEFIYLFYFFKYLSVIQFRYIGEKADVSTLCSLDVALLRGNSSKGEMALYCIIILHLLPSSVSAFEFIYTREKGESLLSL